MITARQIATAINRRRIFPTLISDTGLVGGGVTLSRHTAGSFHLRVSKVFTPMLAEPATAEAIADALGGMVVVYIENITPARTRVTAFMSVISGGDVHVGRLGEPLPSLPYQLNSAIMTADGGPIDTSQDCVCATVSPLRWKRWSEGRLRATGEVCATCRKTV
jgi:hypothetical protein